jgi:hypothetical protein
LIHRHETSALEALVRSVVIKQACIGSTCFIHAGRTDAQKTRP